MKKFEEDEQPLLPLAERENTKDDDNDQCDECYRKNCRKWLVKCQMLLPSWAQQGISSVVTHFRKQMLSRSKSRQLTSTVISYVQEERVMCLFMLIVTGWLFCCSGTPRVPMNTEQYHSDQVHNNLMSQVQELTSHQRQLTSSVDQQKSDMEQLTSRVNQVTVSQDPKTVNHEAQKCSIANTNCIDNETISAIQSDVDNLKSYKEYTLHIEMGRVARNVAAELCRDCIRERDLQIIKRDSADLRVNIRSVETRVTDCCNNANPKLHIIEQKITRLEQEINKYIIVNIGLGIASMVFLCLLCCQVCH